MVVSSGHVENYAKILRESQVPWHVISVIIGLFIGSFLNVVIYRVPRGESIVWPGSHCVACGHELRPWELIPVVSYVLLRGRCQSCSEKISFRYPLVEILTAAVFFMAYSQGGLSVWTAAGWVFGAILIAVAFTDIDEGIIPDVITYPGMLAGLIFSFFTIGWKPSLMGLFSFAIVFFAIALISRGGMGGGDVKLAGVIGAFTGLEGALLVFILSSLAGGIWAVGLLIVGGAGRKTEVRFGPFLAIAAFLVFLYGQEILSFYLRLFL